MLFLEGFCATNGIKKQSKNDQKQSNVFQSSQKQRQAIKSNRQQLRAVTSNQKQPKAIKSNQHAFKSNQQAIKPSNTTPTPQQHSTGLEKSNHKRLTKQPQLTESR